MRKMYAPSSPLPVREQYVKRRAMVCACKAEQEHRPFFWLVYVLYSFADSERNRRPATTLFLEFCGTAVKKFVKLSRGILKEDPVDKRWIVDYLSPVVLKMFHSENNLREVKDAFDFVKSEHQKMVDQSNTKLSVRYKILLDYFEMNAGDIISFIQ